MVPGEKAGEELLGGGMDGGLVGAVLGQRPPGLRGEDAPAAPGAADPGFHQGKAKALFRRTDQFEGLGVGEVHLFGGLMERAGPLHPLQKLRRPGPKHFFPALLNRTT